MWPTIFNIFKAFSILLIGVVIKILDDYMDREIDAILGNKLNPLLENSGVLPYTLLLFSIACILDVNTSVSLFLASYAVGMAGNLSATMPSSLYGYQESLAILILGPLVFGFKCFASSMSIIIVLQLLDDDLDYEKDRCLKSNWSYILGRVESRLLALIFFLASIYMDVFKTLVAVSSYFIITFFLEKLNGSGDHAIKKEGQ